MEIVMLLMTSDVIVKVFNMITRIDEVKKWIKHISRDFKSNSIL